MRAAAEEKPARFVHVKARGGLSEVDGGGDMRWPPGRGGRGSEEPPRHSRRARGSGDQFECFITMNMDSLVFTDSEEEEEAEMIFLLLPVLYLACRKTRIPCNTSSTSKKHFRDGTYNNIQTPRIDINDSPGLEDEYERQNNWHVVQRNESVGQSYDYPQNLNEESFVAEDGDDDQVQKSVTSASAVIKPKKQKGTTSVPCIEESVMAYVDLKTKQASMKEQASQQETQYSITRCLEVLNAMDDVSDEVKIFVSDAFKDATKREIFLGYNSRLRGLWLKKEVDKILPQPPTSRC